MPRHFFLLTPFFCVFFALCGCFEKSEEVITQRHAGGQKKVSLWVKPGGKITKKTEWYGNGIKELEVPYKDSLAHGKYTRWSSHGDIIGTGTYVKGKLDGEQRTFFVPKKIRSVSFYEMGKRVGDWEEFNFAGGKFKEEHYSGDSAVGVWKRWFPNGTLAAENSCHETLARGFMKTYSETGAQRLEYECSFGKKDGHFLEFYPSGKLRVEANFKADTLNGERLFYYANGSLKKREFWNLGVRDSLWTEFGISGEVLAEFSFEGGTGKVLGECKKAGDCNADTSFVENFIDGLVRRTDPERGLQFEEVWERGSKKSVRGRYLATGALASEGHFEAGKPHGTWMNFYPDGSVKDSLNYVRGERFGEQKSYDPEGNLVRFTKEAGKNRPVIFLPGSAE